MKNEVMKNEVMKNEVMKSEECHDYIPDCRNWKSPIKRLQYIPNKKTRKMTFP